MNNNQNSANSNRTNLGNVIKEVCYFLTLLFWVLRACGVIDWSWIWVMSPVIFLWTTILIGYGIIGVSMVVARVIIKIFKH